MHIVMYGPCSTGSTPPCRLGQLALATLLALVATVAGLSAPTALRAGEGPNPGPSLPDSATTGTAGADANSAVGREARITQLLQQLLAERAELAAMRREQQRQSEDFAANRFVLERGLAARDAEIAQVVTEEADAWQALSGIRHRLERQRLAAQGLRAQFQRYLPVLRDHVAHAMDAGRVERLAAVDALIADAQAGLTPPTDLLQKLGRLQETEEALARSIERVPVRLEPDREVDGLRVGLAMVQAPAGTGGGAVALTPGDGQTETAVQTQVGAEQGQGLTQALQILQRRRSPDFTDLLMPNLALTEKVAPAAGPIVPLPATEQTLIPNYGLEIRLSPLPTPVSVPSIPPVALTAGGAETTAPAPAVPADPLARLQAELAALRTEKARFAAAAATERQQVIDRLSALENADAERAQWLKTARQRIAHEQDKQDRAGDDLQIAEEQASLFEQALQSTRDQLIERLTGSLEVAAQPQMAAGLALLRADLHAQPTAGPDRESDATQRTRRLLATVFDIHTRLLAAARSMAIFSLQVKLADGRLIPAQCLQVSLLGGYFCDPASDEAGVLVADPAQAGVWRGESRGLARLQIQAIAHRIRYPAEANALPFDVTGGAALIQATNAWNLSEWFAAGGKVMWPLLLVAIAGFVLVLERAVALVRLQGRTRDLLAGVEAALVGGRFEEAQTLCDPARGPVQRVLHAGLIHRNDSRTVIEDAIQAAALGEIPALQKGLGMIALLAGLAPLLGLLGTVTGMINTFQMVNLFGSSDTRFLAGGISEALITTEFGLFMAIPLVFCHGVLTRLSERVLTTIELGAAMLVQRLSPRAPNGASTPSGAPMSGPVQRRDTVVVEAGAKPTSEAVVVVTNQAAATASPAADRR